jgi:hypothetical protein
MMRIDLKMVTIAALLSLSCTTKVSEWVLLNAPAERYHLVRYLEGAGSPAELKQAADLGKRLQGANAVVRTENKSGGSGPSVPWALWYGKRLFSGYSQVNSLAGLETSPLREKIAGELMAGKLCVMLYLKTGDPVKDNPFALVVRQAAEGSPFSTILPVVELDRNDPAEKHFIAMLLDVEEDLESLSEPMLFGIFGRFRVLEPLVGRGITRENIDLMVDFFTADCSCIIKEDLPGISILYKGSWENPAPALVNPILDRFPALQHR